MGIEFNPETKINFSLPDNKTGTKRTSTKLPTSADLREAMKKLAEKSEPADTSENHTISLTGGDKDISADSVKSKQVNISTKLKIDMDSNVKKSMDTNGNTYIVSECMDMNGNRHVISQRIDAKTGIITKSVTVEGQIPLRQSTPNDNRLDAPDNFWMWMNGCYGENDKVLSQDGNTTTLKTIEQTEDGPETLYYKVTKNEDGTTSIQRGLRVLPDGSTIDYEKSNMIKVYDNKTGKLISQRLGDDITLFEPNGKHHTEKVK